MPFVNFGGGGGIRPDNLFFRNYAFIRHRFVPINASSTAVPYMYAFLYWMFKVVTILSLEVLHYNATMRSIG